MKNKINPSGTLGTGPVSHEFATGACKGLSELINRYQVIEPNVVKELLFAGAQLNLRQCTRVTSVSLRE